MVRLFVISLIFNISTSFALDLDALRLNESFLIEEIFDDLKSDKDFEKHESAKPKAILKKILSDPEGKIRKEFKIEPYFQSSVLFWSQIYTQFTSKQMLIHDKRNLAIVYDALDFTELHKSKELNRYQIARKQSRIIKNSVEDLRKQLRQIGSGKKLSTKAKKLRKHLISIGVNIPQKRSSRIRKFNSLAKNLRVQTGQQDKIFQGIINSYPFENFLNSKFDYFELPRELLAISFVESSFNLKATSKVGASGVWQIMPFISKSILPEGRAKRPRRNVLLATLGAFHLLAQNYKILKRWDLAVTAYNSGTKHLLRARRKFKKKNISLAFILKNYKTRHLGFASKNFYAEFLALVHVLAYKDNMFPLDGVDLETASTNPKLRYKEISVYLSKCGLRPSRLYSALKSSSPHLSKINNHLRNSKRLYPRGTLIFSDIHLTSKRYKKLTNKQLRRNFPKNYKKLLRKRDRCQKS